MKLCVGSVIITCYSRTISNGRLPDWSTFLHMILQSRDPRRAWPLVDWLTGFRVDINSSQAFKEASKIHLLQQVILEAGWHFQLGQPIVQDFMSNIAHPYKGTWYCCH